MAFSFARSLGPAVASSALFLAACSAPAQGTPFTRDWQRLPAVIQFDAAPGQIIFAVSDVHGGYDRLLLLLAKNGVIAGAPAKPSDVHWAAGTATLVVVGDLFDKGPEGLKVIDVLMALEGSAKAAGGRVVVTLGNHEAEFLDDPRNAKASKKDGIDAEIAREHLNPDAVASSADVHGAWLRTLPFAARVGPWFFAHAGNTGGGSAVDIEQRLERALAVDGFHADAVIGPTSILEDHGWAKDHALIASEASALHVGHFVVGHDPGAYGPRGEIAVVGDGALFRIDVGMSPGIDLSDGRLLRIRPDTADASAEIAESLKPDGSAQILWRGHR